MQCTADRVERVWILVFVCLLFTACITACKANPQLELVGTLEHTQIDLIAPVSEVIVEISANRGQEVEASQSLIRLDATLATAEVRRAEAVLAGARTAVRVSQHELRRARELRESSIASQQTFERAELQYDEATAGLRQAESALAAARKRVEDLDLRAPTAALVDQLPYEVGERVPAGSVVAVLLRRERPWIRVWLPEPYLARVRPGLEAQIALDGWSQHLHGRILEIAREPTFTPYFALTERERAHLSYETRVELLEEPEGIRPGVPATVRLPIASDEAQWRLPFFGRNGDG